MQSFLNEENLHQQRSHTLRESDSSDYLNMPIDVIAIVTPKAGVEDRVEEALIDLAAKVQKHETDVERYVPTKVVGREGTPEFVVIERYASSQCHCLPAKQRYFG
jgi:hypothetical protein